MSKMLHKRAHELSTCMNESYHTYEWVISYTWMSHVFISDLLMNLTNIWTSHVTYDSAHTRRASKEHDSIRQWIQITSQTLAMTVRMHVSVDVVVAASHCSMDVLSFLWPSTCFHYSSLNMSVDECRVIFFSTQHVQSPRLNSLIKQIRFWAVICG